MSANTKLDANQVIKTVYDEATGSLKVVGLDPIVSRLAADTDSVSIGDPSASNFVEVTADGQVPALTSPSFVDTTIWLNVIDASLDADSSAVNILSYRIAGVMVNWDSLDQADATIQFEGSLDNSIWDDIGAPVTLATASGDEFFSLIDEPYKYMRLSYDHGTNTTGTLTAKYILRA